MKIWRSDRHCTADAARRAWFLLALLVAATSQIWLAVTLGPQVGGERARWVVALSLWSGLGLPAAGVLLASWAARDIPASPLMLGAIAVTGLVMRLPYLGVGPALEDDHFRYLLDGAMTARGLDPYAFSPQALLVGNAPETYLRAAEPGRDVIGWINFPELRSIYPGTSQLLFALAHFIGPWSLDGLRVVMLICEATTAILCVRCLVGLSLPVHRIALLWCNPLMAFCLTGQAHVDAALGPLLVAMLLAVKLSKAGLAGGALGLAVGIKLWPVMLLPLVIRALGHDRRSQAICVITMGSVAFLSCAQLFWASLSAQSGLTAYASGWHMNNLPYEWVSYVLSEIAGGSGLERYLRGTIVVASVGIALAIAIRPVGDKHDFAARLALVSAAVFYLSPAQFPWYAAWFVPFAVLAGNWPLLVATASLPSYFLFFPMTGTEWWNVYRFGLSGLHLLPVVVVALLMWARRTRAAA